MRFDPAEQETDREDAFLLEVLDQAADPAGEPDPFGGVAGPLRGGDPVEHHRHGQADHAEQRNHHEQRELAADPEPTEQHRTAPTVRSSGSRAAPTGCSARGSAAGGCHGSRGGGVSGLSASGRGQGGPPACPATGGDQQRGEPAQQQDGDDTRPDGQPAVPVEPVDALGAAARPVRSRMTGWSCRAAAAS